MPVELGRGAMPDFQEILVDLEEVPSGTTTAARVASTFGKNEK